MTTATITTATTTTGRTGATGAAPVQEARVSRGLRWRAMSLLMRTAGRRLSRGIDLGYRRGFDSGEMLDYVYENRAHGPLLIGRVIDRVYLDAVGWRAIRNRRKLLQAMLVEEIGANRARRRLTRIVDVASGPGRYLLDVIRNAGGHDVRTVCRDLSATGVQAGRRLAAQLGVRGVRYERGDAFDPASIGTIEPRPNVIVVSGLHELFLDHGRIQRSLAALHEKAAPGAAIFVTTQVSHPQLDFIANVLPNREGVPWIMECRASSLTERWLAEAGFEVVRTETEPLGLFAVTKARKRA